MFRLLPNFAIFLVFFGFSLIDAVRSRNLFAVSLFVALGLAFLHADAGRDED